MLNTKITLVIGLLASGCASKVSNLDPIIVNRPSVSIPDPLPLRLNTVTWKVLNLADIKALAKQKNIDPFFALTEENYQNFSLNLVEIKRYIQEQNAVLVLTKTLLNDQTAPSSTDNLAALPNLMSPTPTSKP